MIKLSSPKSALLLASAAAALSAGALPAAAAAPGAVPLPSSIAPFSHKVRVLGEAAPSAPVHFTVALKLRDYAGLRAANEAGKQTSWAELEARHLPTVADYDAVLNFLTDAGLRIDTRSKSRMTVQASGTAEQVSRALGVHFSRIESEGRAYVSADSAPSVPAGLAHAVQGINGLQPQAHAIKYSHVRKADATTPAYWAQAFLTGYGATGLGDGGAGTTTAIVIDVFPLKRDLTRYWTVTGTAQTLDNISFIKTKAIVFGPPSGEESMDTEVTSSMAPNSKVRVYGSGDLQFTSIDGAFQQMIDEQAAGQPLDQVSISLGACETEVGSDQVMTDDNFFAVMTAQGSSIFVSSGDSGSDTCEDGTRKPSFFSTSPNVTAVGGTALTLNEVGSTTSETAWSGSGGGLSRYFRPPAWQSSLGFARRAVPDISADADPDTGALVYVAQVPLQVGGTSLSAPIWAGLTALANAGRHANGKASLGLLNPRLYALGGPNYRDIVEGDNGGWSAQAGYDLVTGLGAPRMNVLYNAMQKK